MSTVTNIVNRLLVEDLQDVVDSPDKAFKALQNSALFEAPSKRLRRSLSKLLRENEENLNATLADCFYQFQTAQGRPYTPSRAKGRAKKWLEKNTVPERETVFEICFSLQEKLKTIDAVKELITIGFGEYGFNVRSAKECVYCYCFASGKSYADAQRILSEYGKAEVGNRYESEYRIESDGSGDTTQLLRRGLYKEWDTEEDFKRFLCDNKALFIEYSKSFVREYKELYHRLSSKIRLIHICEEFKHVENATAFFHLVKREVPDLMVKNARLAKLYNQYLEAKKDVNVDALNEYYSDNQGKLFDIWGQVILPQIRELKKSVPANQMERFISQGIPRIKRDSRSLDYNRGQKRNTARSAASGHKAEASTDIAAYTARAKNKDSELYVSTSYGVMAQFPQRNDILTPEELYHSLESAPETNPFEPLYYRKLFLLMFYYDYFFDAFYPSSDQGCLPQKFHLRAFIQEIAETLYRCNLAPLYRNEHFDWLILSSAAAIVNGCAPSSTTDEADNISILGRISGPLYDYDLDALCRVIENAADDEVNGLYGHLFDDSNTSIEGMRKELVEAIMDEDEPAALDRLEELIDEDINGSGSYEDALMQLGHNPLDFFGQVLRISYGF